VKLLLEKPGVHVNSEDDGGRSSLTYAAESGHAAVVILLREKCHTTWLLFTFLFEHGK